MKGNLFLSVIVLIGIIVTIGINLYLLKSVNSSLEVVKDISQKQSAIEQSIQQLQGQIEESVNHTPIALQMDQEKQFTEEDAKNNVYDALINKIVDEAEQSFNIKKYRESLKSYEKILTLDPGNINAVQKRILCLYYINPMDSNNYSVILKDINYLEKTNSLTKEIMNIKKNITSEISN